MDANATPKTDRDVIADAVYTDQAASEPICRVGAILGQFVVEPVGSFGFDVEIRDANSLAVYRFTGLDADAVLDCYDAATETLRSRTLVYYV